MADYSKRKVDKDLVGLALDTLAQPGGDRLFPSGDAEDMMRGARFIPGDVTMARRAGGSVVFHDQCSPCCWYWESIDDTSGRYGMGQGDREYHWDRGAWMAIGRANGRTYAKKEGAKSYDSETFDYPDGAGPCPQCGNKNTGGGGMLMLGGVLYKVGSNNRLDNFTFSHMEEGEEKERVKALLEAGYLNESTFTSQLTGREYTVRHKGRNTPWEFVDVELLSNGFPETGDMDHAVIDAANAISKQRRRESFDNGYHRFDDPYGMLMRLMEEEGEDGRY